MSTVLNDPAVGWPSAGCRVPPPGSGGFTTLAQHLERLGNVPPDRIWFTPAVGTATVADWERSIAAGHRPELIFGTLVEKTMGWRQGLFAAVLIELFAPAIEKGRLGVLVGDQSFIRMPDDHRRSPDVAYYSRSRLPGGKPPRENVPAVYPDIAIEVLSDSNTAGEMKLKRREFFGAGTIWFWMIEPQLRRVDVYDSVDTFRSYRDGDHLTAPGLLPALSVSVTELFDRLT